MVEPNDMYHQNYPLHLQGAFLDQHRRTSFVAADPMMSMFLNTTHHSDRNRRFNKEPAFILEPRIRAAQMPELPEFFSQSRSLCSEVSGKNSNNTHNERLLKLVKSQSPPPSPLMLLPNSLLEMTTGQRFSNRYSHNANRIMSENVQQRYLFSKRPNYGPLSIPVTTTYHPVTSSIRKNQDGNLFDREESQNYNYKFRSFGRRPSDTREPMPKLGQGDARLGDGILFEGRKLDSNLSLNKAPGYHPRTKCNVSTSLPSLTYSSYSSKSPAKTYYPQTEVSRFGPRNLRCASPQRAPAPVPIGPVPVKVKKKIVDRPPTPSSIDNDSKYCVPVTHEEHQLRAKSVNIQPGEVPSKVITEPAAKKIPTGPKSMMSNNNHQLDATAPVFQPAFQTRIRARPAKWKTQCRWTYNSVGDCRYGSTCHWGHEGDEYLDEPGVQHSFIKDSCFSGELSGNAEHDQSRSQNGPIDYSVYSTSSEYEVQQQSDDGVRKYGDGRLPDFSWVGGATNVNSWMGIHGRNNPIYGHQLANTYESVQGMSKAPNGSQIENDNSENNQGHLEKEEEGKPNAAVMAGGQNDGQLQHLPAECAELEQMNGKIDKALFIGDWDPKKNLRVQKTPDGFAGGFLLAHKWMTGDLVQE